MGSRLPITYSSQFSSCVRKTSSTKLFTASRSPLFVNTMLFPSKSSSGTRKRPSEPSPMTKSNSWSRLVEIQKCSATHHPRTSYPSLATTATPVLVRCECGGAPEPLSDFSHLLVRLCFVFAPASSSCLLSPVSRLLPPTSCLLSADPAQEGRPSNFGDSISFPSGGA